MVNWTGDVDAKLFAAVLKQVNTSLNYQQLAADMATQGIECTPKACSHRIANIKNRAKAGGTPNSTPKKAAPTTPRGNKRAATATPKSGSAKRAKRDITPADSDISYPEEAEREDPDGEWGGKVRVKSEGGENRGGGGRGRSRSATVVTSYKEESDDEADEVAEELALYRAAEEAAEEI